MGFPEEERRALGSGQYGVKSVTFLSFLTGSLTETAKGRRVYFGSGFESGQLTMTRK